MTNDGNSYFGHRRSVDVFNQSVETAKKQQQQRQEVNLVGRRWLVAATLVGVQFGNNKSPPLPLVIGNSSTQYNNTTTVSTANCNNSS